MKNTRIDEKMQVILDETVAKIGDVVTLTSEYSGGNLSEGQACIVTGFTLREARSPWTLMVVYDTDKGLIWPNETEGYVFPAQDEKDLLLLAQNMKRNK